MEINLDINVGLLNAKQQKTQPSQWHLNKKWRHDDTKITYIIHNLHAPGGIVMRLNQGITWASWN